MGEDKSAEPFRRQLFDLLERSRRGDNLARLLDIVLVTLILASVAASVVETVPWIKARYGATLIQFNRFCVAVFIFEYLARLWTAPEHPALQGKAAWRARLVFAASPMMILDLVAISPFFIELAIGADFAVVRILRILRFYRLARYSPVLATIVGVIAAEWRSLMGSAILFGALLLFSGVAMYLAERHVQPEYLGDVPSAMWWAVVTLSTVGYGDVVPMTLAGRMVAGLTMVFGIVFFALPVGIIATSFQEKIRRRDFVVSFSMVARVPLFAQLNASSVARLIALLRARRVAAGEVIVARGEEADAMYFINAGQVEVDTPSGAITLSDGDFFGEIALVVEGQRRNANVVAVKASDLLVLSASDFKNLMVTNAEISEAVGEVANQRMKNSKPDDDGV
jgi:voltage-gated potassium channel